MSPEEKTGIDARIERIMRDRRSVSPEGREVLTKAVQIDHDWALPASSVDMLIEALSVLSDDDLEAANLLAQHMNEAATCLLIRRDTAKLPPTGGAR